VSRHQSGEQRQREEERGSQVSHSLSPFYSQLNEAGAICFRKVLTVTDVPYMFQTQIIGTGLEPMPCHTPRPAPPAAALRAGAKKKPQPFRAGALRCRRGGGRGCRSPRGGECRTSSPLSGSRKKSIGSGRLGSSINEAPRMCAEAPRRQLPFQATISRPRFLLTPVRRFGKAASTPKRARLDQGGGGASVNHKEDWTGASGRVSLPGAKKKAGVSRTASNPLADIAPNSIGGVNRDCEGSECRDVESWQVSGCFHRKCLIGIRLVNANRGGASK
jgi:hypothetical protein